MSPGWNLPIRMALLCATLAGCGGGGDSDVQDMQKSNLRGLAVWYSQYQARHRGNYPQDQEDFKAFIASVTAQTNAGGEVAQLFVSERDGKPYVVRYRGDKKWPLEGVVAYEQEGSDGVRYAAGHLGDVSQFTDEEFKNRMDTGSKPNQGGQRPGAGG